MWILSLVIFVRFVAAIQNALLTEQNRKSAFTHSKMGVNAATFEDWDPQDEIELIDFVVT